MVGNLAVAVAAAPSRVIWVWLRTWPLAGEQAAGCYDLRRSRP